MWVGDIVIRALGNGISPTCVWCMCVGRGVIVVGVVDVKCASVVGRE